MKSDIKVPTGTVVGIGKLKIFATERFPHEIPTLSFLVAKGEDGLYVSSCLHLLLDGHGKTVKESIENMQSICQDFLTMLFENEKSKATAWDQIRESFTDNGISEYWAAYKEMQVNFAERNISTSIQSALEKQIRELQEELNHCNGECREMKVVAYQAISEAA